MAKVRSRKPSKKTSLKENLWFYWRLVKSKVIMGLMIMILVRAWLVIDTGWMSALDRAGGWDWLIAVTIFFLLAAKLCNHSAFTYFRAIMTGAVAGFSLGLAISLIDLILYRNSWVLMNVLKKPLFFLVLGSVSMIIVCVFKSNNHKKIKN